MLVLFTDSDTDITPVEAEALGYKLISMPYSFGDDVVFPYRDGNDVNFKEFYDLLRSGTIPKTSALSPGEYLNYFEPEFKAGNDILYVHFSKAMSGTFNSMNIALEELKEKYPDRKLYTIDTKGITILSNIIVKKVAELYKQGLSINELLDWAEKEVDHYAVYFYADDLKFFQRSGRISNFSAIMGTIFSFHPILHMNSAGVISSLTKARGRKATLNKIADYFEELVLEPTEHKIIIGHSDALDIAHLLGKILEERMHAKLDIEYVCINPTAGAHCGPDCVGVTFYAKRR